MKLVINGHDRVVPGDASIGSLVAEHARSPRGTAVAVNGEVVPRREWSEVRLAEGDRLEILTAVGGG